MRLLRTFVCAAALVAASALGVQPAFAAAPANDTIGGATTASLGFSQVLDTTEATTDADDAQLNESCGAPATDASVWYTITLAADGGVIVDVSASDYPAGVLVGVGTPGALETVACGPGAVVFSAAAGTTYYVLAIDDQSDGAGNGGALNISFNEPPPPPTLDVNVAPRGTFNSQTGVVTIHGTYTCTDADFIDIFGNVAQPVGRIATIRGSFELLRRGHVRRLQPPMECRRGPGERQVRGRPGPRSGLLVRLRRVRVRRWLHRADGAAHRPTQLAQPGDAEPSLTRREDAHFAVSPGGFRIPPR